jgi:hypothetical protein
MRSTTPLRTPARRSRPPLEAPIGRTASIVATLHYPEGDHRFFVTLCAVIASNLAAFAGEAQPIIDSLRLPATYFRN